MSASCALCPLRNPYEKHKTETENPAACARSGLMRKGEVGREHDHATSGAFPWARQGPGT